MKVLIRNKERNKKAFVEMRQITLTEEGPDIYSLTATDMEGKKIVLKKLSKERADDIEMKICQDFVIDLTPDFDKFLKAKETDKPEEIIDAFSDRVEMLFADINKKGL